MNKKNKNIITVAAIGVLIYFLLRKKKGKIQAKSGGGGGTQQSGGSNNIFNTGNVSAAKKGQIKARVKSEVSKLNLQPIVDDWQDAKTQYDKDVKECNI